MFNNAPDLVAALRKSIEENQELRRQAEEHFAERIQTISREMLDKAGFTPSGIKLVTMQGIRLPEVVKGVAFAVRTLSAENTAFIGATVDPSGKPLLTVMLTDDLTKTHNASQMVREAARSIKGGGGGQPGFAQAGGKDADGINIALKTLTEALG